MRQDFPSKVKKARLAHSGGRCEGILTDGITRCNQPFSPSNPVEFDHDREDWEGGEPTFENCRALGKKCCHRPKTSAATGRRAKADRAGKAHIGLKPKPVHKIASRPRREIMPRDDEARSRRIRSKHEAHLAKRAIGAQRELDPDT